MNEMEIYSIYKDYFANSMLPYIKCKNCDYSFYYPKNRCPQCGSDKIEIKKSSGTGEIYSYTVFNNSIWAIVSFPEGFRLYMNIDSAGEPDIGKKIKIKFIDGRPYGSC
ncbi:zinc ribbon domain-containing protein [Acidiplasma sp.]|uniref:Zn-ribbon domain-containing OB-fold protein n=1 Tax=Acidiplasma sp. TaxID=1872114 RepID=UPI0025826FFA|nr:zinc ribbon domain-containing protein [Acidiplasma sp.]